MDKTKKWLAPFSLAVFAATIILYVISVVLAGGQPAGPFLYLLAFLLLAGLPGHYLCTLLFPGATGAGKVCLGATLGCAALMLSYAALGSFAPLWVCALPPLALCALALAGLAKRRRPGFVKSFYGSIPSPLWALLILFCAAWALQMLAGLFTYAHPVKSGGSHLFNQDLAWSVGNAAAVRMGFPLADLRMAGGHMNYHYFGDAVTGLLAYFSLQSAWDAWNFLSWPIYAACLMLGLYGICRRLGAGKWAALLGPAGAFFLLGKSEAEIIFLYPNPNAVLNSYLFMAGALVAALALEETGFSSWRGVLGYAIAMAAFAWTKSTTSLLMLCAFSAAFIVFSISRRRISKGMLAAVLSGWAVYLVLYLAIISKAHNTMYIDNVAAQAKEIGLFLVGRHGFLLVLYIASVILCLINFKKLGFVHLAANAFIIGGILASILFYHYANSQIYFVVAAIVLMWVNVAASAQWIAQSPAKALRIGAGCFAALCCALSAAQFAKAFMPLAQNGVQTALRCAGLRQPFADYIHEVYFAPEDEEAALWLKEHMETDEVFATNRTSKELVWGDGVTHLYTAFSERQAFTEGWFYAMQYSHERLDAIHILEEVSDVIFFESKDWASASALAEEYGIAYLLLYKPYRPQGIPGATPVFENNAAYIYRVDN